MSGVSNEGGQARRPRPELFLSLMLTVGWGALVFALDGILAAVLDRDPIGPGVPILFGPITFVLGALVTFACLVWATTAAAPWRPSLAALAGVYVLSVLSGVFVGVGLVSAQASSPFVLLAAATSALVVFGSWIAFRRWPGNG